MRNIAIFGGTFDPVHIGHLNISLAIQKHFNFELYYFLPCKTPTIKAPAFANTQQRVAMLELALSPYNQFKVDLREIQRTLPSYMVDTLKSFRVENPDACISLIIGYDAFLSLPKWHQWQDILKLSNLLVINRPGFKVTPSQEINELLITHQVNTVKRLKSSKAGVIYLFDAGHYDVSSTTIRGQLQHQLSVDIEVPQTVKEYIMRWKLYR